MLKKLKKKIIYFLKRFRISTVAILAQVRNTAFWLKVEYFVLPKMAECIPLDYPVGCPNCRRLLSVCTSTKFDKDFICSICLDETSEQLVVAECGHVFCFVCINGYAKHKNKNKNKNKGRPTVNDRYDREMIGYIEQCYIASKILLNFNFKDTVPMEVFNSSEFSDVALSATNVRWILRITQELEEHVLPQLGSVTSNLENYITSVYNAYSFDRFDIYDLAKFIGDWLYYITETTLRYSYMFSCLENRIELEELMVSLQQAVNKVRQIADSSPLGS